MSIKHLKQNLCKILNKELEIIFKSKHKQCDEEVKLAAQKYSLQEKLCETNRNKN